MVTSGKKSGSSDKTAVEGMKIPFLDLYLVRGEKVRLWQKTKAIRNGMWLTPRANETDEDPKKFSKRMGDRNPNFAGTLKAQVKQQGKLNPNWVEQLMGLPVGWTDLGCWETG